MAANDTQVGGGHYKQNSADTPEHWDLVLMYNWDYFQGQIIKYLMRWKTKHQTEEKRLEDLKKSAHFLQKYIEHEERKLMGREPAGPVITELKPSFGKLNQIVRQEAETKLDEDPDSRVTWFPAHAYVPANTPGLAPDRRPEQHTNDEWECEGFYGDMTQLYRHRKSRWLTRQRSLEAAEHAYRAAGPGTATPGLHVPMNGV